MGVLASSHEPLIPGGPDSWQAAVLVYNSDDNSTSTSTDDVTVSLRGLAAQTGTFTKTLLEVQQTFVSVSPWFIQPCCYRPVCSAGLVYVTYYIDNNVSNPYQLWQNMGRPDYPTAQQFRSLRSVQVNSRAEPSCTNNMVMLYTVIFQNCW